MTLRTVASLVISFAFITTALTTFARGDDAHPSGPNLTMTKTAFGRTGDPAKVNRAVHIDMSDTMRFDPAQLTVRKGETVRFIIANGGKLMHELVLGTTQALAKHAEHMKRHAGMEHDEPYMVHVKPGMTGEIVWQFTQPGEFKYACLLPGHSEAGMVGTIRVTDK